MTDIATINLTITVRFKVSLWSALKIRLAGQNLEQLKKNLEVALTSPDTSPDSLADLERHINDH